MYIYNGLCQRNIVAVPPDFCIRLHFGNNTFLTQRPERFQLTGLKIIRFDDYNNYSSKILRWHFFKKLHYRFQTYRLKLIGVHAHIKLAAAVCPVQQIVT